MIHHEISIPEAMKVKDGKAAMLKEWDKLERPVGRSAAWDVNLVESKATAMQRGRDNKVVYHFGSIKELCHIKNYEKGYEEWVYKGRNCFPR